MPLLERLAGVARLWIAQPAFQRAPERLGGAGGVATDVAVEADPEPGHRGVRRARRLEPAALGLPHLIPGLRKPSHDIPEVVPRPRELVRLEEGVGEEELRTRALGVTETRRAMGLDPAPPALDVGEDGRLAVLVDAAPA